MPRPRPARISGTDHVIVSVIGRIARTNVEAVGSSTAPSNSARYAPQTAVHTAEKKSEGRANR